MKITADENLALVDYFFADKAQIDYKAGRKITSDDLQHTQALLVRSVTKVNETLLASTPVSFVGSATIGTDHLDIAALQANAIQVAHAPGCNAQAVAEYVVTALLTLRPELINAEKAFALGIVGLGNVGKRLAKLANRLGWRVLGTDPHVQLDNVENLGLTELLIQADAISLHVPLEKAGENPTYHLIDSTAFQRMKADCILINSSRGAVVSEQALLHDLADDLATSKRQVVLDVFEFEPRIHQTLLDQLALATPHIAGYSLEGKARGTEMVYQAWCQHFGFDISKQLEGQLPDMPQLFTAGQPINAQLLALLLKLYDIEADDQALRACVDAEGWVEAGQFDRLRKEYPLRREWLAYGDQAPSLADSLAE